MPLESTLDAMFDPAVDRQTRMQRLRGRLAARREQVSLHEAAIMEMERELAMLEKTNDDDEITVADFLDVIERHP